jgi:flagella basal body P-ring formation protein FlgA
MGTCGKGRARGAPRAVARMLAVCALALSASAAAPACASPSAAEVPIVGSAAELQAAIDHLLGESFPDRPPVWTLAREHAFAPGSRLQLLAPQRLSGGRNWFQLRECPPGVRSFLLGVDLLWEETVWIATRPLAAGAQLRADDCTQRLCRHPYPREAVQLAAPPAGQCLASAVAAGTVLTRELLQPPPLIARGHRVRLVYARPGLTITAQAEALEDGRAGETIRVRPLDGRRVCEGVVRGPDDVEVSLP